MTHTVASLVVAALTASCAALSLERPSLLVVEVQARGLSAADVESRITVPIEGALAQVKNIKTLRSTSTDGTVAIEIEFESPVSEDKRQDVLVVLRRFPVGFGGSTSSPQVRMAPAQTLVHRP